MIFQNFCYSFFLGKFGPIIWNTSSWLKFGWEVDYYMLILILIFFFSTFFSFIFFGTIRPKIWSSSNWQKLAKIYEQQILWKVKHQNHYQHIKMCPCIKFQLVWRALDFGTKFPKNYVNDKILNHIPIYPCTKFQSIWRTSNFGTKFTQEMTEKNFKNKNYIEVSI